MTKKLGIAAALLLATIGLAPAPARAADPPKGGKPKVALPAGVEAVTAVEGVSEYRLANGMRVLLFPDRSKSTITVNITYLAGSRHEGYGETGMAHLIEHMVFKGSTRHPNIPQELTAHGARPNGTTWFDRTNYFETFAATDENLDWALDLEADRMVNSFMKKADLDSEMTVVRNEFESGENDAKAVLIDRLMSTAYLWHNYGQSTIGSRSDLENVPIEALTAFYRKWYQPDNAILVVAGKIDEAKTLALVAEKFGVIPRPTRPLPADYTVEPAQDGERFVELRRVGDSQMTGAVWHVPAGSHPDFAAVEVLSYLLGDEPSGRLYKGLVETKQAASISASAWSLHDPGVLMVTAEARVGQSLDEVRKAMLKICEEAAATRPTDAEVDRAKQAILKGWELMLRNPERAGIEISEYAATGDWRLMFLHRDRVRAVKADDVVRVAKAYLKAENRTSGSFVPTKSPERAEIPATPDLAATLKGYTGGAAMVEGEELAPDPAVLEARIVRRKLSSGLSLVMMPKKTRGGMVHASLTLRFGDAKSLAGRATAGDIGGDLLMRGTKTKSRQQIQDEIDRLTARISVSGSPSGAQASLEVPKANLAAAMKLVAEILREPSFPAAELETLRQEQLLRAEESLSDPFQKASTTWGRHLNPWPATDPRYQESAEERIASLKAVTLEEIRKFHADFYGASNGELSVVGDFDPKEVEALAKSLLGGWKSPKPWGRLANPYADRPALVTKIETPDKESAVVQAGMRIALKDSDPDYPGLLLGNFMTGGGFLNSRIATRLRQKEGLSYGAGTFFSASAWEPDATWGFYAIYAPQNSELLVRAFREEVQKVLEAGFTADEIAQAKKGWLDSRRVSRAQERELARTLGARQYTSRTLAFDADLEAKIEALTGEQILAAMKRHLDPAKISLVEAGDFAGAKAKAESGQLPATRTGK